MSRGVTKLAYYEGRVEFLTSLLKGHLSGKQRRAAEQELMQANVCRLMAVKRPRELKRDS